MDKQSKNFSDRCIDFIFSKDTRKYLLFFLLIAFFLRLIVANNVAPLADEMIHGTNAINIISSGVINAQNEAPAWLYMTDIFYKIFGVHAFSARMLSILFGSLTVLMVFLIGRQFFNDRLALAAAFLMAISAFYIRYTLMEMDHAMMFFVLAAFYYFIKDIKKNKKIPYKSGLLMGVAVLIKPITLPFIASFALCFLILSYGSRDRLKLLQANKGRIIQIMLILLLFATPILAYNYILYQQKGITDVIFSRFLGINQDIYSSLQGYDKTFVLSEVFYLGIPAFVKSYLHLDPAIFLLGLAGMAIALSFKQYKQQRILLWFSIIPLIFLLGTSLLQTHLSIFVPIFCLFSATAISFICDKFPSKSPKTIIYVTLALVLLVNIYLLLPHLTSQASMFKLREYAIDNVQTNDVIVADSRIYRGRIAWSLNDKAYLESNSLSALLQLNENISGSKVHTRLLFVECVSDDCGWGTIKDQPDFNRSTEEIVSLFKKNAQELVTFNGGGGYDEITGNPTLRVYSTNIALSPNVFPAIYAAHDWFYYPVRWQKSDWYDKYEPETFLQIVFHNTGVFFLWLGIVLAYVFAFLIIRESFNRQSYTY